MALVGLTRTATRTALGTSSRNSPSRLARTSEVRKLIPLALPPGRARLATKPFATGSSVTLKAIGIVAVAALAASVAGSPIVAITATRRADEVGHKRRQAVVSAAEPVVLDDHVLTLYVARFAEAFAQRGCRACGTIERSTADKANHRSRRLLRARASIGHEVAAPPPSSVMNSRRLTRSPRWQAPAVQAGWSSQAPGPF